MRLYENNLELVNSETFADPEKNLFIDFEDSLSNLTKFTSIPVLDLKEPFTYKVLESLNIGSHVEFCINPYIHYGFYIISKEISNFLIIGADTPSLNFAKHVFSVIRINFAIETITDEKFKEHLNRKIMIDLTEIDLVNRIFTLRDLNSGNYGLIDIDDLKNPSNLNVTWINNHHEFKIIDFIHSAMKSTEYKSENICNDFIKGNTINKYETGSVMYEAVQRIPIYILNSDDYSPPEIVIKEKCYFGHFAFQQFKKRVEQWNDSLPIDEKLSQDENLEVKLKHLLTTNAKYIKNLLLTKRNDLPVLRERTNAELIGFQSKTNFICQPDLQITTQNTNPNIPYIEDQLNDMDTYCEGIIYNFHKIYEFIEENYQKYFGSV